MSEDVTAVSMQVSEKAAEAALSAFKSVLDSVGRLFRELLGMEHDRARAKAQMKAAKGGAQTPEKTKSPNVSATNLTGIKPGEVSLKDIAENARNTGEALSVAQNGFSQEDRKAIARTAKKYGIPVAFSNTKGKNNLYANVRSGDLPIFNAMQILPAIAAILPNKGAPENPAYLAQTGLTFFGTWISRIGGLVAFIGAIKFALSIKSDETRDQLPALLTMVSGFMIQAAIANLGIFELATTNAETIFQNILLFIGRWTRRVGAAGTLVGAVMFGFSIKDNNAVGKVAALKTFAAGAIVVSVSGILHTFI